MKLLKLTAAAIACATIVGSVNAAPTSVYLKNSDGTLVKSSSGQCWRTGYWNPIDAANDPAVCECDAGAVSELVCMRNFAPAPQVLQPQPRVAAPAQLPVARAPQRFVLNEGVSFKFGKYELQNQARPILNNVVLVSNEVNAIRIVITGHTDRIGSDKTNIKLSQNRANEVRDYLVRQGLPYNMIQTTGVGKSNPVTGNSCNNLGKDSSRNKKLIDCLAPDRRVNIDIYGEK